VVSATFAGMPDVSVIVPCFNQAGFLAECLESLRTQTLGDWEAIVVDDASTDGDVAHAIADLGDGRVAVVRHRANRGLAASRNTGMRQARAELLLPLDCDDGLRPDFLEKTVACLRDAASVDCVFTDFELFGATDDVWVNSVGEPSEILVRQWLPGPGTLMRRTVWERVGGYCEDPALSSGNEDWDFWIAGVESGLVARPIPEPLYRYRRHSQSMSSLQLRQHEYRQREFMYRRHKRFFDSHGKGGVFRADGYLGSAGFAWRRGDRGRAVAIAGRGLVTKGVGWSLVKRGFIVSSTLLRNSRPRRRPGLPS